MKYVRQFNQIRKNDYLERMSGIYYDYKRVL